MESECSICDQDYVECPHIAKETYSGTLCSVCIKSIDMCDFSVVKNPINPRALIDQFDLK